MLRLVVECPPGNPEALTFGHTAPVTTHSVKYSHHPDGEAHFSQDSKVFTRVRKKAVPLTEADGHLFTLMVQGLHRFEDFNERDIPSPRRGIVSMPVLEGKIEALKFVAHLYSSNRLAQMLQRPKMESALIPLQFSDGKRLVGAVLASKLTREHQQYLLVISVEEIKTIAAYTDFYVSLLGGFDPPGIVFNHSLPMSFLIMVYPEPADLSALIESVGSIDRM